jgi:hypothetical protein
MFDTITALWGESRGRVLWQEYLNLTKHLAALPEPDAERCGHACAFLVTQWGETFGPIEKSEISLRKRAVKEFKDEAKQRYDTDRGTSLAYGLFSINMEASYLSGEDAKQAYALSSQAIIEIAAKVAAEKRQKRPTWLARRPASACGACSRTTVAIASLGTKSAPARSPSTPRERMRRSRRRRSASRSACPM